MRTRQFSPGMIDFEKKVLRALLLCSFCIFLSENYLYNGNLPSTSDIGNISAGAQAFVVDESNACANAEASGAGWAKNKAVALERHTDDPAHGDVCRILLFASNEGNEGAVGGAHFCPLRCRSVETSPWCLDAEFGAKCTVASSASLAVSSANVFPGTPQEETAVAPLAAAAAAAAPKHDHTTTMAAAAPDGPAEAAGDAGSKATAAASVDRAAPAALVMVATAKRAAEALNKTTLLDLEQQEEEGTAPACVVGSDGVTATKNVGEGSSDEVVILERHDENPAHGDVCRRYLRQDWRRRKQEEGGKSSSSHLHIGFFCPVSCSHTTGAPYCKAADEAAEAAAPCRVLHTKHASPSNNTAASGLVDILAGFVDRLAGFVVVGGDKTDGGNGDRGGEGGARLLRQNPGAAVSEPTAPSSSSFASLRFIKNAETADLLAKQAAQTPKKASSSESSSSRQRPLLLLPPLSGFGAEVSRLAKKTQRIARRRAKKSDDDDNLDDNNDEEEEEEEAGDEVGGDNAMAVSKGEGGRPRHVQCSPFTPTLLTLEPPLSNHDLESFQGYVRYYGQFERNLAKSLSNEGDFVLTELFLDDRNAEHQDLAHDVAHEPSAHDDGHDGDDDYFDLLEHDLDLEHGSSRDNDNDRLDSHFILNPATLAADASHQPQPQQQPQQQQPAKLLMQGRGDVMSSWAWNSTHSVRPDPLGPRSGGSLVWSPPAHAPSRQQWQSLSCDQHVWVNGPLVALANWFPGNFHHWLHDTLPTLLFLARFRVPPTARFALVDHPLHRSLLGWLDPSLARRVEWVTLGQVTCVHDAATKATLGSTPAKLRHKGTAEADHALKQEQKQEQKQELMRRARHDRQRERGQEKLEAELALLAVEALEAGMAPPTPPLFQVESTQLTKVGAAKKTKVGAPPPPPAAAAASVPLPPPLLATGQSGVAADPKGQRQPYRPSLVTVQYRSALSRRDDTAPPSSSNPHAKLTQIRIKNSEQRNAAAAAAGTTGGSAARLQAASSGEWPPLSDGATVFNLRNSALSTLMALEIARLKPRQEEVPQQQQAQAEAATFPGGAGGASSLQPPPQPQPAAESATVVLPVAVAQTAAARPRTIRRPTIVFYRRWSRTTLHGRSMSLDHEAQLLSVLKRLMAQFNRPEALSVFTGENPDTGTPLSFQAQFDAFRDATMVIGPHGAGLANLVWLQPSPVACAKGPVVIEFICTKESSSVQNGCPGKSHWSLLGGVPWIRYHHLFLARNSTAQPAGSLFVEASELEAALTTVFLNQLKPLAAFPWKEVNASMGNSEDPLPMLVSNDVAVATESVVPYFFHMPKAAGTSIERILSTKRKMKTLPAGDVEDLLYVERSQALKRKIINYIKTPLFSEACGLFGRSGFKARAFTVLREPVGRVVSLFWYKKDSTWEKSFDPKYRNQSMERFLTEDAEHNWLAMTLATAVVPRGPPPEREFLFSTLETKKKAKTQQTKKQQAKEQAKKEKDRDRQHSDSNNRLPHNNDNDNDNSVSAPTTVSSAATHARGMLSRRDSLVHAAARYVLLEKLVVGFMDDLENSCAMIFASFGWEYTAGDIAALSRNVNTRVVKKTLPSPLLSAVAALEGASSTKTHKDETDPVAVYLPRIQKLNQLDISLYREARGLYDQRKKTVVAKKY